MGVLQPTYSRLLVAATLLVSLACDVVAAVDQREEDIQLAYRGTHYDVLTTDSRSAAGRTVAAIQHLVTRSSADHYNCGATFISPHFAVTAGHCTESLVAGGTYPAGTFLVRTFDAVNMNVAEALELGIVDTSAGWPNWESGSVFNYLDIAGLTVNSLACRVYCDGVTCWDRVYAQGVIPDGLTRTQLENLRDEQGNRVLADPDIAIIECPGRTETYIAGVAADPNPAATVAVETRWFHEVLDLDVTNTASPEWEHYGFFDNGPNANNLVNNYHYTWPHPILALRTNKTPAGATATIHQVNRVQHPNFPTEDMKFVGYSISSTLPGCHGTSGSGVFLAGSSYTYGPVHGPGTGALGIQSGVPYGPSNELCATRLRTAHPWPVRQFNRMTRLVNDRNGVYTPAF